MGMGLLEAFDNINSYGKYVLDIDEILFAASAWKKKGCRTYKSRLTKDDIEKILSLGKKVKDWKESR